jgi:hypothetical protein
MKKAKKVKTDICLLSQSWENNNYTGSNIALAILKKCILHQKLFCFLGAPILFPPTVAGGWRQKKCYNRETIPFISISFHQ